MKELLGEKPLVLDREFSYLELLEDLVTEQVNFVIVSTPKPLCLTRKVIPLF